MLFFFGHATYHWYFGFPQNVLWACHLGALVVGLGLVLRSAAVNGIGVLWLGIGTPLWLIGLIAGGRFTPTSVLTHVGGLALGLWGVSRLGLPRGVWWKALGGVVVLHFLSRWLTPEDRNVNMAMRIWPGFENFFPSHGLFLAAAFVVCLGLFVGLELFLRSWLDGRARIPAGP